MQLKRLVHVQHATEFRDGPGFDHSGAISAKPVAVNIDIWS